MASITLHRASRVLDSIAKAIKLEEPKTSAKLSLFAPDLQAEVSRITAETERAVDRMEKLHDAKGAIRSQVGVANAQTGISVLLSRKGSLEAKVAMLEALPGVSTVKPEPEDEMAMYRRRRAKPAPVAAIVTETVIATATAMKTRFEGTTGEAGASEIEVGTVTVDQAAAYRRKVVAIRRELDGIADELRGLNAATSIEVDDLYMDWLRSNDVI